MINLEGRYPSVHYAEEKIKAHRVCDLPGSLRAVSLIFLAPGTSFPVPERQFSYGLE